MLNKRLQLQNHNAHITDEKPDVALLHTLPILSLKMGNFYILCLCKDIAFYDFYLLVSPQVF